MSGKKGMKHFSQEIFIRLEHLKEEGRCHREIGEIVGLSHKQVKKFFERQRKRKRDIENGWMPKQKGRPRQRVSTPEERIRELEREVELLKAFLRAAGRM